MSEKVAIWLISWSFGIMISSSPLALPPINFFVCNWDRFEDRLFLFGSFVVAFSI